MDFQRAAHLAKRNPGAILARDHDGSFIVRNPDGTLVTEGIHHGRSDDLENAASLLEDTIRDLKSKLHQQESANASLVEELKVAKNQIEILTKRFSMISVEELKRIETREFEDRRSERHTVQCSCLGEVENCHFCYGRGTYVTDGFGNKI